MAKTPSERTIESISNHGFLEILNAGKVAPPFAWFFLPTQNEEAVLGYDAALVGFKRLYIQYKRMDKGHKFKFGFRQIWTLCALLPRYGKPYVFLSGNLVPDYPALTACHGAPGGGRFKAFDQTFFIDAWGVLITLCEAVNGAPLSAFPNILPPPLGKKNLSYVTLKPAVGPIAFTIPLTKALTLWQSIISLLWALSYHGPFHSKSPFAYIVTSPEGFGVDFASETLRCSFGKPFPTEPSFRDVIGEYADDLGKPSVLTVPMP